MRLCLKRKLFGQLNVPSVYCEHENWGRFRFSRQWQMGSNASWYLITEQCEGFRFSFSTISNASFMLHTYFRRIHTLSAGMFLLKIVCNDMTLNDMFTRLFNLEDVVSMLAWNVWLNCSKQKFHYEITFHDYSKQLLLAQLIWIHFWQMETELFKWFHLANVCVYVFFIVWHLNGCGFKMYTYNVGVFAGFLCLLQIVFLSLHTKRVAYY